MHWTGKLSPHIKSNRSSDESFGFSASETPRLFPFDSMEREETNRYSSSRKPMNKKSIPNKGFQSFTPRSAGSVRRPHRSEHVSELIDFFKTYDLPLHHRDLSMASCEPHTTSPRNTEQYQWGHKGYEAHSKHKRKPTTRMLSPDIWSRPSSKERRKHERSERPNTDNFEPRSPVNTPNTPRSFSGATTPIQGIDRQGEVGGECAYPGVGVLPSLPHSFTNLRKGSDVSSYVDSHDLSSVTLTNDMSISDNVDWTETSTGRDILSGFGMGFDPPKTSCSDNGKEHTNGDDETITPEKTGHGFNINIWDQQQLQPSVNPDGVAGGQVQVGQHDSICAVRPHSVDSMLDKRRSITTICRESTYIDIRYLPRRISSKKERRAGRAEFTNLCCRLSYPEPEGDTFGDNEGCGDLKRGESAGEPMQWDMVSGQATSFQSQAGLSASAVEDGGVFRSEPSASNRSSENSSCYGFAFSPMSNNSPITDVTSPITWNDFPERIKERRAYTPNTPVELTPWVLNDDRKENAGGRDGKLSQGSTNQTHEGNSNDLHTSGYNFRCESKKQRDLSSRLPLRDAVESKATSSGDGPKYTAAQNTRLRTKFNLPLNTAALKNGGSPKDADISGRIGTVLETPQETSPQFWNPSIDELCGQSGRAGSAASGSITKRPVDISRELNTPPISPRGTVMGVHGAPKNNPRPRKEERTVTPLGHAPRHSRSFPTPNQPRPLLLSPRSAAGLRVQGTSSRAVSPSLPSSDEEGMGTRANRRKSRRSTRSDRSRSQRNSPLQFSPEIPERESSVRLQNRPSCRDSSLSSPCSTTSFSRPSTSGSFATVQQQQHLHDRVYFLERQNKMLQAALISALDVGSTYEADMIRSGFAISPRAAITGAGDEISDMLSLYRQSCASINTPGNRSFSFSYYNSGATSATSAQLDMNFASAERSQSASDMGRMRSRILSDSDVASLNGLLSQAS